MSMATRTDTQSPVPHVADRHDLIRVQGAGEHLKESASRSEAPVTVSPASRARERAPWGQHDAAESQR